MKEKVGLNTRKDPPKGLIRLQLSLYAEVGTPTKGERDEGCDGQAITSTGRQKSWGDKQPMDRRSISTHTKEPGR